MMECTHYQRGCSFRSTCCDTFYPCRKCHDDRADHDFNRFGVHECKCNACGMVSAPAQKCPFCHHVWGEYACLKCFLFESKPGFEAYHCDKCGICRAGQAEDHVHCDVCNLCWPASGHQCSGRATTSDDVCPICLYSLLDRDSVVVLRCGHKLHHSCNRANMEAGNWKCPSCNQSVVGPEMMSGHREHLRQLEAQNPVPPEYENWTASIACNDCNSEHSVRFSMLGQYVCPECESINTRVLGNFSNE